MGNQVGHYSAPHDFRDFPDSRLESKYEPMFGFPKGRKVRVMKATQMELDSALVPVRFRDYCADKYLKTRACKEEHFPWVGRCHNFVHAWEECQYQDNLIRMKEYEREKRLDRRQKRLLKKQKKEQEAD